MKRFLAISFFSLCLLGYAQVEWQNPNFREKIIFAQDSVVLDSLQILPEKFVLKDFKGNPVSTDLYRVNGNVLLLNENVSDSLRVSYYVHPQFKKIVTYPKDPSLIVASASENSAIILDNQPAKEIELFDGLNSKGTFVRGLLFGNNQGSSVQSSLNLQLDGKLSDDVGITAFISDTNAPIEVGGYTQSLDQFERIYIEMFTKKSKIRAGHIDLEQNDDYFGKYQRKVTGLLVSHEFETGASSNKIMAAGSLGRGQYTRYEFLGIEGNQGPYRLVGNENEAYVLIIAGSERVYRNGQLLEYGEEKDYVLDYTTGEITFTTQHLVTVNDRYIVEYQYTHRNYNRFTWVAGLEHSSDRFKIAGHIYSESDNKNNPINQNLTDDDKRLLSKAGSDTHQIYTDSAVPADYQEDRVLYKKTIVNGKAIYEYSNDPKEDLYQVSFTYVGQHQGDYILSNRGVNGRVFIYVPAVQNVPQGDYAPIRQLIAPEKKQVISLSSAYSLPNNGQVNLDVGLSKDDANLFSNQGDKENVGLGIKLGGFKEVNIGQWNLKPDFRYEYIQAEFKPIERLRAPEFARDFNLENETGNTDQHYLQSNLSLNIQDSLHLNYGFDYLNQVSAYQGYRHRFNGTFNKNNYTLVGRASYLNTNALTQETDFRRYHINASKKLKRMKLETGINGESNRHLYGAQDSLSSRWTEFYAASMIGDSLQRFVGWRVYHRRDDSTRLSSLVPYARSWGMQLNSRLIYTDIQSLEVLADYRNVNYEVDLPGASFLNANINYRKAFLNQGVNLNLNYGLAGNTEQQRAFAYARVADGMGLYQWIDFNGDGVQQIDEFELAEFTDQANYIRVYTHVVQSIRTNQNRVGLNLSIFPSKFLEAEIFKRFQSRWVYQQVGNFLKNNHIAAWNPFENEDLKRGGSSNLFIQNEWNKGNNYQWHFSHQYKNTEHINFIYTGLESIVHKENKFDLQYDLNEFMQAELIQNIQSTNSDSEAFANRRYKIKGQSWSPKFNFDWSLGVQSSLAYTFSNFKNTSGVEKLKSHQLDFILNWQALDKSQLIANLSWINHHFRGNPDQLIASRLMGGLREGENWVWNLSVSRHINSFMTLDIQYDGRKNQKLKAIHTGNIMIRLNF